MQVAQENMDVFKDAWERNVRLLTEAVDDITTIDDFLAVSGVYSSNQNFVKCGKIITIKQYLVCGHKTMAF